MFGIKLYMPDVDLENVSPQCSGMIKSYCQSTSQHERANLFLFMAV